MPLSRHRLLPVTFAAVLISGCQPESASQTQATGPGTTTPTTAASSASTAKPAAKDPLVAYDEKRSTAPEEVATYPIGPETEPDDSPILLPLEPHWRKIDQQQYEAAWLGSPGDVHYVRVRNKDLPPADLTDIDGQREFFRTVTRKENGGILSVETQEVQGHPCVVVLSKEVVPNIRGYRYVARAFFPAFPTADCWTEVRMDAIQMGATGMREAIATTSLGANMEMEEIPEDAAPTPGPSLPSTPGSKRIKGFFFDPYDPAFNSSAINSIADDPKYDELSPQHPLTRLRRSFAPLLEKLTFVDAEK